MNGYTKLFSTILTSTIWQEPIEVKVLWITMLALSDKNGYVSGSIPGLAHVAGISLEACQKGIQCLSSPDSFSRTKIEDGRRIREADGGWELVNHAKYRVLLSAEERKEYNRRKQQEHRERLRAEAVKSASNMSAKVKQCQQKPDIADADAKADTGKSITNETLPGTTLPPAQTLSLESPLLPPPEPPPQPTAQDIYSAYPRKVGKADALKAISKALKAKSPADLLAATQAYAEAVKTWPEADKCYIPHPATWFNRGSYDDDPATWKRGKDDSEAAKTLKYTY